MLLALCAVSAGAEPQGNAKPSGAARIYFLRHGGLFFATPVVRINGQQIGSLDNHTYLMVTRPPGRYVIGVRERWIDSRTGFETEIQVAAGGAYFFEVGSLPARTNIQQFVNDLAGITGRPMPAQKEGAFWFYSLDPKEGAAKVKDMTAVKP